MRILNKHLYKYLSMICLLSCGLLFAIPDLAHAQSEDRGKTGPSRQEACAKAQPLAMIGDMTGYQISPGETRCFVIDISQPTILLVDVSLPLHVSDSSTMRVLPKLGLLGQRWISGRHSASSLLMAIETPGDYFFGVAAQDPDRSLRQFKIVTRSVPLADLGLLSVAGPMPFEDLGEIGETGVLELEPDPPLDPEGDEESLTFSAPGLCDRAPGDGLGDNHDETFLCPTVLTLGESMQGHLGHEDVDVFTFTLEQRRTVRVQTTGADSTLGEFYNLHQECLFPQAQGKPRGQARSLAPGRYFVRVESRAGDGGTYQILIEDIGW